jgi:microcystin-dependent protein
MILDPQTSAQVVLAGAVAANQPEAHVEYRDWNPQGETTKPALFRTAANSTTDVTILAAPNQGFIREVLRCSIYNKDTASVTVTVKTDDGTTERIICKAVLLTLETLNFEMGRGWYATNASGAEKTATGAVVPSGTIMDFGGTSAPTGYLACDGSAVSRSTYGDLFAAIGTTWGSGDGSTTFNVPSFARRVAVGSGGSGTATLANSVGSTGGAETHTLTTGEMPAHTHPETANNNASTGAGNEPKGVPDSTGNTVSSAITGSTGGGGAHNNMQPSAVVLKIIKT